MVFDIAMEVIRDKIEKMVNEYDIWGADRALLIEAITEYCLSKLRESLKEVIELSDKIESGGGKLLLRSGERLRGSETRYEIS